MSKSDATSDRSRRIALVEERIQLVESLTALLPHYIKNYPIQHPVVGGWTHIWEKVDSLRNYLLLTCFDVLGGRSAFLDFQSWLRSRRTSSERQEVVASLPADATPCDVAAALHKRYLAGHGATRSFRRFLHENLPANAREELLDSIWVREIDIVADPHREIRVIDDPKIKEDFLFDIRNKFTHEARDSGSPGYALFPEWADGILVDGKRRMGNILIHSIKYEKTRIDYHVRDWPNALIRAIRAGVAGLTIQ